MNQDEHSKTGVQKPKVILSEIEFSNGKIIELNEDEKIILVGPNNSGKSQSLREIVNICQTGDIKNTLVVKSLKLLKNGNSSDLLGYLEHTAELIEGQYRLSDYQIHEQHVKRWDLSPFLTHGLHQGSIKNIVANDRLEICNPQSSISPGQQKSRPQHVLYDNDTLMKKISGLFKSAFGKDLMFDFRGGSQIPIHVGKVPTGTVDRVSDEYINKVRKNPKLDLQGDGIKSYAGILFEAIVNERDITLIDEPEAFLHPPQMRRLGETLSSEVRGQLLVATHSSDILRGFLEGTKGKIRILRISREHNINTVYEASSMTIKELWDKPELRYSNALEGIFHEQTIICEDDSDCRLINSVADYISTEGSPIKDTAYVPTGGKHGIPKVASVLRQIGVPIKAIFDIDFLSEQELVKRTVLSFGGNWAEIVLLWRRVDEAVRGGLPAKSNLDIKSEIVTLLNASDRDALPKGDVLSIMKQGKSWTHIKKYGEIAIPKGQAQQDYKALKDSLETIGIFVVPVGEVENFCPEIGSHGPKFVTKLLSTVSLSSPELGRLRDFVKRVHEQ